ncbi:MAG: ATP-binding protein [Deltaproteobacteria bacterium]|nr:ATP-binding protein [Deltaproteobacteria bacterium]
MWIERDWADALTTFARRFPAVLVTGPRQVGKTSLLRRCFPDANYVSFDEATLARQAETQPDTFFADRPEPLVLDEVQYVPALFRELKVRIDRARRPGRFLMTGSQSLPLMQSVSESLAGRCGILEMSSLSWREARAAHPRLGDLDFLATGGFPELHAGGPLTAADFYPSYVATYLERDVRNLKQVGSLRDFDRFLRAAALRTGQLLSFSDLARDVGIAPNTAKAWLSVLQATGQVLLVEPYHRSLGRRLVKSPKLYFADAGLAGHLLGIRDRATLLASPLAGALWETFVVGQVVRTHQVRRERPPIWFWRTPRGDEVDLLIEHGGRFVAVECKLTERPDDAATRGIRALAAFYGPRTLERAFVACRVPHAHRLGPDGIAAAVSVDGLVAEL